jgi:hypothetical protein
MGNLVYVKNQDNKIIGRLYLSLSCFAIVNKIVKKYTGEYLPIFGDINTALEPVYKQCLPHEEVQLLVFINEKTTFDTDDKSKFDAAIRLWTIENDGPKKHLECVRSLLEKYATITLEYSGVSTSTITVGKSSE